jgi:hypothetical protein
VNLYDFLLNGKLGLSQFVDGDTIVVGPRQHTFSVEGDVFNSYDFEFANSTISVTEALSWARLKPKATHMTIIRQQGTMKRSEYYPLSSAAGRSLQDEDRLIVSSDRYAQAPSRYVLMAHILVSMPWCCHTVPPCAQVLAQIRPNSMSQMKAIQLYASVATRQKEMLDLSLQKLEEASFRPNPQRKKKPVCVCRKRNWSAASSIKRTLCRKDKWYLMRATSTRYCWKMAMSS